MELIPKDFDTRRLSKGMLSKFFGKEPLRLVKVIEKARQKFGDRRFKDAYLTKGDKYYVKLGEFLGCGKRGLVEIDKDGVKQYRPFFCNLRRMCFECFNRYKKGLRWTYEERILAVARAAKVSQIVFPVYTLHTEIRDYLTTYHKLDPAESLNEINRLAVDSFKQVVGVGKHWGRDVTGIISVMHPFGSRNPFKDFLHFHFAWIPLKITPGGIVKRMRSFVDSKKARELWQAAQVQFAKRHGFNLASPETNIHFEWIPLSAEAKLRHKIRYIFRSLLDDIFISVRFLTDDLEGFIWLEDVESDWLPHLDKWEKLEHALESYMNFPVKMVKSYGFLRNIKKYAEVLHLEQAFDKPGFVPVVTKACEFRRTYRRHYLEGKKKWIFKLSIQAAYDGHPWANIPIEDVIGERCSGGSRYKWIRGP